MLRTRRQKALAPCEDVFSTLPSELSERVIAGMPPDSLARLALTSKALSSLVAVRVIDKEVWSAPIKLLKDASELKHAVRSLAFRAHRCAFGVKKDAEDKEKAHHMGVALLARLKTMCSSREAVVVQLEQAVRDQNGEGLSYGSCGLFSCYSHSGITNQVSALLRKQRKQCVVACSLAMKPDAFLAFASKVTESQNWDEEQRRRTWSDTFSSAIRSNVHRLDWTPHLVVDLAERSPAYKDKPDVESLTLLLDAIPLSLTALKACLRDADLPVEAAAAALLSHINKIWSDQHDDDEWEYEYEDDFEQEQCFKDRAQLFLTVTRQLAPPVAVILLLVRKLIKEDRERHKEIDENNHPDHNEYHITYARFVATRTFLAGWAAFMDFTRLSGHETEALAAGLASFKNSEVKACFVPIALEWTMALVQPLKQPGRRSNQQDAELAATVERVCRTMLA